MTFKLSSLFKNLLTVDTLCVIVCVCAQYFVIVPFLCNEREQAVTQKFQQELVDKGFAEYNSETGQWQYKQLILFKPKPIKEDFSDLDRIAVIPDRPLSSYRKKQ